MDNQEADEKRPGLLMGVIISLLKLGQVYRKEHWGQNCLDINVILY